MHLYCWLPSRPPSRREVFCTLSSVTRTRPRWGRLRCRHQQPWVLDPSQEVSPALVGRDNRIPVGVELGDVGRSGLAVVGFRRGRENQQHRSGRSWHPWGDGPVTARCAPGCRHRFPRKVTRSTGAFFERGTSKPDGHGGERHCTLVAVAPGDGEANRTPCPEQDLASRGPTCAADCNGTTILIGRARD